MQINLDLGYRMKRREEEQFLDPFEVEDVNAKIRDMQALMASPDQAAEMRQRAADIKDEYIRSLGSFGPRISSFLLRSAVQLRYRKDGPHGAHVEVPRKGADKTKPGVWWGDLQIELEDYPAYIDVPVVVAQWIVATWFDDKVQNGLPDTVQAWANAFEKEMTRVQAELEGKKVGE